MNSKEHIQQLQKITEQIIEQSELLFSSINEEEFNHNIHPKKWSVAQCLNHLNRYADFYHKQFKEVLNEEEKEHLAKENEAIKYSWITRNFLKYVQLDKDDNPQKKTKATRNSYQVNSDFTKKELDAFLDNQKEMLSLLMMAEDKSSYRFKKIKTKFPLLSLKAIDLFAINVHHNYRHFVQAKNTLEQVKIQSN